MTDAPTHFTDQERRILLVLSDGDRHRRDELMPCLDDDLSSPAALVMCISRIRAKLKRRGEYIVAEYVNRQCLYRHVRLIRYDE